MDGILTFLIVIRGGGKYVLLVTMSPVQAGQDGSEVHHRSVWSKPLLVSFSSGEEGDGGYILAESQVGRRPDPRLAVRGPNREARATSDGGQRVTRR